MPVLVAGIYVFLIAAVVFGSLSPWSLVALLGLIQAGKVIATSWKHYGDGSRMAVARRSAFVVHLIIGVCIAASSPPGLWR